MREIQGDIWDYHGQGWVVIPTNTTVKRDGSAVMGAGLAKQAAERYPDLPKRYGEILRYYGPHPYGHDRLGARLILLPTKRSWREPSDLGLIETNVRAVSELGEDVQVYLPRLGCGPHTGQLDWKDVKPVMEKYLDDRFTVVSLEVT